VSDDGSNEDASPDFFWESAAKITEHGWTLEMRIPFSSLRYKNIDPQVWTILLYRNFPREYHYQFFSAKLPRGGNCFVCRSNTLIGMEHLPGGGHLVAAPYVSATADAHPRDDVAGAPLVDDGVKPHVGIDVKYTPNADNAIDLTIKPDFSQVESDTAQISANERFALSFPEKRPFFLEGADLFQTPIQTVYTRTITAPVWGGRVTGKEAGFRYTALVADDAGGGSAIIPGPNGSTMARWTRGRPSSSGGSNGIWACRLSVCWPPIARHSRATATTASLVRTSSGGHPERTWSRARRCTAKRVRRTARTSPTSGRGRSPRTRPAFSGTTIRRISIATRNTRIWEMAFAPIPASSRRSAIGRPSAAADGRSGRPGL
jgi:hypothetical protein